MIATLMLAAAASPSGGPDATVSSPSPASAIQRDAPIQLAQLTIEQRVIIRIPLVPPPGVVMQRNAAVAPPVPPAPADLPTFKEVKGPKCIKLKRIRGAVIAFGSGITMLTEGDERFRTHFGRMCRAADFYAGFYIEPNKEGTLCAGRDELHARNGSSCGIERFSKLVPDD